MIKSKILYFFLNTVFNGVTSVAVIVFFAFCIGYFLARYDFRGKNLVNSLLMLGLVVPVHSLLVPLSGPILITVIIITLNFAWNEFPFSLVLKDNVPTREGAHEIVDESQLLFGQPVSFIFITHGHEDHMDGLPVFLDQNVTIYCSERCRPDPCGKGREQSNRSRDQRSDSSEDGGPGGGVPRP